MTNTAPETRSIAVGETRNVSVSFVGLLDDNELLTGTPTTTVSPSGPTLDHARINATALHINGRPVATGQAVLFQISDVTADTEYTVTVTATTDMVPAQTLTAIKNQLDDLKQQAAVAGMESVDAQKKMLAQKGLKGQDLIDAQKAVQDKYDRDKAKSITDSGQTPQEKAFKDLQEAYRLTQKTGEDGNPLLSDKAFERRKKQINEDLTKGAIGVDNTADEGRFTSGLGARLGRQDPVLEATQKIATGIDEVSKTLEDMLKELQDANQDQAKQVEIKDFS